MLDVDTELRSALDAFEEVLQENVLVQSVSYEESDDMERVTLGEKVIGILIRG
ncbi:hypothetical protein D3C78_1573100 [compost metagenome]